MSETGLNPDEVAKRVEASRVARGAIEAKVVAAARAIVPVLLDAGRVNSAKELQELFFQLDVEEEKLKDLIQGNAKAAIMALTAHLTAHLKRGMP